MEGQEQLKKSKVVKINSKESWEQKISHATNQGYPVVVHFSAFWCVPSVVMNPFFEELASTYQKVKFLTLDVDEVKDGFGSSPKFLLSNISPKFSQHLTDIASKLEIKAMPTFLLLSGGDPVDKIVGANPDEIRKKVDHFILSTHSNKSI